MKENELKQPFFASLLESQRTQAEGEKRWPWEPPISRPGGEEVTMKAPSDDDEIPPSM